MIKMFFSPAMPDKYVAQTADGSKWIIPATPMSPKAWERAVPYKGNLKLFPAAFGVERFYQPA